jgi:hypothetical protein
MTSMFHRRNKKGFPVRIKFSQNFIILIETPGYGEPVPVLETGA